MAPTWQGGRRGGSVGRSPASDRGAMGRRRSRPLLVLRQAQRPPEDKHRTHRGKRAHHEGYADGKEHAPDQMPLLEERHGDGHRGGTEQEVNELSPRKEALVGHLEEPQGSRQDQDRGQDGAAVAGPTARRPRSRCRRSSSARSAARPRGRPRDRRGCASAGLRFPVAEEAMRQNEGPDRQGQGDHAVTPDDSSRWS